MVFRLTFNYVAECEEGGRQKWNRRTQDVSFVPTLYINAKILTYIHVSIHINVQIDTLTDTHDIQIDRLNRQAGGEIHTCRVKQTNILINRRTDMQTNKQKKDRLTERKIDSTRRLMKRKSWIDRITDRQTETQTGEQKDRQPEKHRKIGTLLD